MLHTKVKVVATSLILSVGLIGCEGLLSSLTGNVLEKYLNDLEAGEATVEVTNIDTATFDRLDVWLEKIDPEELDLELEDLEDDAAVKQAAEDWVAQKEENLPDSIPEDFAAGYGFESGDSAWSNDAVSETVFTDANVGTNTNDITVIENGSSTELEGYVYVVYALLRASDGSSPEIAVHYVVVDGAETDPDPVSLDYEATDTFQTF